MKRVWHLIIPLWLLAVCWVTPKIDRYNFAVNAEKGIDQKDILFKTIGEAKRLLSGLSYLRADRYYHGGVDHFDKDKKKCLEHLAHNHSEHHETHGHSKENFSRFNILARIGDQISIHEHRHLHGDEEKEIIPWLYYAVKLDPNNVNAYVIGGYWLGERLKRTEQAIRFLQKGARNNPESWEIHSQIAAIYFRQKKDYKLAIKYYEKARSLLTDQNSTKFDRRTLLGFLSASYEQTGDYSKAIHLCEQILQYFPNDHIVIQRIADLQNRTPSP